MAWQELGIEPTRDEQAIRRAYASRLKTLDGAGDPAGFERLRRAYEQALREAEGAREAEEPPRTARRSSTRAPKPGSAPPMPLAARPTIVAQIEASISRGDSGLAAGLLQSAEARLDLSLEDRGRLLRRLKALLLEDDLIRGDDFLVMAGQLGWGDDAVAARQLDTLDWLFERRLAGERWWARLEQLAGGRPGKAPFREVAAARLLTGRAGRHVVWLYNLAPVLAQLLPRDDWQVPLVIGRLDAGRLAWVREVAAGRNRGMRIGSQMVRFAPPVLIGMGLKLGIILIDALLTIAMMVALFLYFLFVGGVVTGRWRYLVAAMLIAALAASPSLRHEVMRLFLDAPAPGRAP